MRPYDDGEDLEPRQVGSGGVDPHTVCRNAGVRTYSIDDKERKVYLKRRGDLLLLADFFDKEVPDTAIGLSMGGWLWLLNEEAFER